MHGSDRARDLRHRLTSAERLLWAALRARRPAGLKFRRQYPLGPYIADFICFERRLIVEVDGESHDGNLEYDLRREARFARKGFATMRFGNEDVKRNLAGVVDAICHAVEIARPLTLSLSQKGRGDDARTALDEGHR